MDMKEVMNKCNESNPIDPDYVTFSENVLINSNLRGSYYEGSCTDNGPDCLYACPCSYLEELNMTGSFPDENVKSAKCFIRCMFMETGLMDSEGNLIADKLKDAFKNHQEPAVNKVADLEKFLDTCVTKSGEIK
ncbi:hypothetical protein Cfor_05425 [Coptotermes formosanus]|uniref:Odorant binding protein n=1 Tax=Coptotermes formosanus TaxID=36987 RepID=A0A6L2Q0D3_COPFO|nr:hypothetical protein Cfor_05425 [Coptotermes formosanus]